MTTLAGSGIAGFADGTGTAAQFASPEGVAVSPDGTTVYVTERQGHRIRRINVSSQAVTTLAGSGTGTAGFADGTGTAAQFRLPGCLTVSPDGTTVYVADRSNNLIRSINVVTQAVTTLAGGTFGRADGTGVAAQFNGTTCVTVSPVGTTVYVADEGNSGIRAIHAIEGQNP